MLDEIRAVRDKYGLPKGVIFVPDRIEISLKRNSYDRLHLSYKEYFDYLPDEILNFAIPNVIAMLVQTGIPREQIERIATNGVRMELDGTSLLIISAILSELSLQKRFTEEEIVQSLKVILALRKTLTDFSELEFVWNSEISQRFLKNLEQMRKISLENPTLSSEMENIMKKYAPSSEKSGENKK